MATVKKQSYIIRGLPLTNKLFEFYLWIIIALFIAFPAIYQFTLYSNSKYIDEILIRNYNKILIAFFFIIAPILYNQVFGMFPFQHLRIYLYNKRNNLKREPGIIKQTYTQVTENKKSNLTKSINKEDFLHYLISESTSISDKIYNRSGAYLLVGCLIAFIGIVVFYSPLFNTPVSQSDIGQKLIDYLPRFGALFFIEFIAFFFLKQYRIMLEEYRYYEAIKRHRQHQNSIIELIEKYKSDPELLKIVLEKFSNPTSNKLASGETTEILETQKILNQEVDVFTKLTELVKEVKSK
ncbi:MAG: hypothetical protein ACO1PI_06645 [Bacteroidota bacterium]